MSSSAPSPATSGPSNPSASSPASNNGSSSGNSSSPPPQIQPTPSNPPATAPLSTSPPPVKSPPSTNSSSPPPVSPPPSPATRSPPPQSNSPPPASSSPPPASSPPPPASSSPPPASSPPPPASSSPPPASSPPPPAVVSPPPKSPPPPSRNPPPSESPPPRSSTSPPPVNPSPPPPTEKPSPSPTAPAPSNLKSPPPPSDPQSPSPPAASPPVSPSTPQSPSPPAASPPVSPPTPQSPSPPAASPPVSPSTPQSPSPKSSPAPPEAPTPSKTPSPPAGTTPGSPPTTPSTKTPPSQSLSPTPNSTATSDSDNSTGGSSSTPAIVGITVGVLVVLGVVGVLFWCIRKKKRRDGYVADHYRHPPPGSISRETDQYLSKASSTPPFPGYGYDNGYKGSVGPLGDVVGDPGQQSPTPGYGNSKPWFSYEELRVATNGFSPQNVLGEGGFGCVYKGYLQDGKVVAVKQLKTGSGQGEREFRAEVEIISRVHHRHLVSLVGYCIADIQRLLVYEFVPNGTLEYHLHGNGRPVMDWPTRLRIAVGAARGIAYLHEDCHPRIIHRDIKSANILLDDRFEAQVSDFGLAKLALDAYTHVTTRVMGTFGYMAPEYASSGKLTQRSDVFSFGVVLLELVTGRKPVDTSQPVGDESLVEWARPLLSHALENGDFETLIDPRLENNFDRVEMFRMIEAAAACVRHSAQRRPQMGQVVRALESDTAIEDLNNGVKPGQSTMYNSAQYSADIRRFRRMAFASQEYGSDFSGVSSEYEMTRSTSSSEFHKSKEVEAKHLRVDLDAQSASGSEFPSSESETRPINVSRTLKDETGERTYGEVPINFRSGPLKGR